MPLLIIHTASAINKLPQLDLKLISDSTTTDMYRTIRQNLDSLIPGLSEKDISTMSLGLSHSLSRHKLKFSTDKVDTMIVQAISLLDDLDKELNMYAMRVREWYGWHFPEMARIVNDNLAYARIILAMGMRSNAANADLAEILPEEIEGAVKHAAEISMGTEVTTEDLEIIQTLAEQVVSFSEYRAQLSSYLSARMQAIAPNLTALVGDLVGARLIAHSGSLMNLAKSPASTVQILGAEKALFRALKTKHDTPKYGLIFHSSLVGQATGKNKGKLARMLANKATCGIRVDSLADWSQEGEGKGDDIAEEDRAAYGNTHRQILERRLAGLEGRSIKPKGVAIAPNGISHKPGKWEVKEARKYNPDADGLAGDEPAKRPVLIEEITTEPARKRMKVDDPSLTKKAEIPITVVAEPDKNPSSDSEGGTDIEMEDDASEKKIDPRLASPLIQEVNGDGKPPRKTATEENDAQSETLDTVSEDTPDSPASPTAAERNWQSPIEGNTKVAKKARKAERHARRLIIGEDRQKERERQREKVARKLDRKHRREQKQQQLERRDVRKTDKMKQLAEQAGLPVKRYQRKLERGEIKFDADGKPQAISKKEIKKVKKLAEAAEQGKDGEVGESKKRKRGEEEDDQEAVQKAERKKSKKQAKKEAKRAAKLSGAAT